MKKTELGIVSFVELTKDNKTYHERINDVLEEIKLADKLGLDFFGIGEHHRSDYAASSPLTILAGAATITKNIKLGSAVVVLSSEDPVRLIEQYRTLNIISNNRAELMVGRGSFIESFPLFGYDLNDYNELFEEKFELLHLLNKEDNLTWQGKYTQSLENVSIYPKIENPLTISVGVGGSRDSIIRAAKYGTPLVLAIIGGNPLFFKSFVQMYKKLYIDFGHDPKNMHITANFHGFVSDDNIELEMFKKASIEQMNIIGKERGWSKYTEVSYNRSIGLNGPLIVGNSKEVALKMNYFIKELELDRILLQVTVGTLPLDMTLRTIRSLATEVKPLLINKDQ